MRRWSVGTNSLYKTADYFLEEAPSWVWLIYDGNLEVNELLTHLPLVHQNLLRTEYSLFDLYWLLIFNKLFHWCDRRTTRWYVPADYETVRTRHNIRGGKEAK